MSERRLYPPAVRARRTAHVISFFAVAFSLGFGVTLRVSLGRMPPGTTFADFFSPDSGLAVAALWLSLALSLLCIALVLRMLAAIFELLWLERAWSNLPEELRRVGPVDNVSSVMVLGFSFVPVVNYVWKLGLVRGIANGLEAVRAETPFRSPVPRRLGTAAVIAGWVPGLNVYLAPFLWEMFARRIDAVVVELGG